MNHKERYAEAPVKVIREAGSHEPYLKNYEIVSDLNEKIQSIAQFNRIRGLNPMLEMTQPKKRFYGYKERKIFPKVAYALGSSEYTNVGMSRAVGTCKWKGSSAYYVQGPRPQKSIFRNKDTRLQFPHLQRCIVDVVQNPPKMYGQYSMRCSNNLVL